MSERWYARAMGIDWTIPVSNGTAQDNKRVEVEKEKAQNEFERALKRFIEDPDLFTSPKSDENNSADNFYLCVLEKIFGKVSDSRWRAVLAGITPPWPKEEILQGMGLRHTNPIISADFTGNVTVVTPTAKDRAVDRLIQEHKQLSEDHRAAADKGQVGLTQQLRERLKSIETALAIAVKEGEVVSDKSKEG